MDRAEERKRIDEIKRQMGDYLTEEDKAKLLPEQKRIHEEMERAERLMYEVEKFTPAQCEKCGHKFEKQNDDWIIVLKPGPVMLSCAHCGHEFVRKSHESYCLFDRAEAERLVREEEFVNLHEVIALGRMAVDSHTVNGEFFVKPEDAQKTQEGGGFRMFLE